MRLTLRTLLAYLDDTLEPAQAKLIGQKVAESDTAQELIARIKQVTRRRGLTAPSPTGGRLDANVIAGYLDSTLSAEQMAEVDQTCLASDVHLAEIAACHQILTLVLGEPALVPPTAKQRMYGLVKGPEAIPFRKPAVTTGDGEDVVPEPRETDETLRLGLPALRARGSWTNRLILLGGGLAIASLLVIAIVQLLQLNQQPPTVDQRVQADVTSKKPPTATTKATPAVVATANKPAPPPEKAPPETDPKVPPVTAKTPLKPGPPPEPPSPPDVPAAEPSTARVVVGQYERNPTSDPSVLLQYVADKSQWQRLDVKKPEVFTGRPLVSLPGYKSLVTLKSGVRLTLWGNVPELWPLPPVLESLVELHQPDPLDADLTLRRGRIVLANTRTDRPVRVRLRFENPTYPSHKEMWDLTLEDRETEVALEYWGQFLRGEPFFKNPKDNLREGPQADLALIVLKGNILLKYDDLKVPMEAPPKRALMLWNSRTGPRGQPSNFPAVPDWRLTPLPFPKGMDDVLKRPRADFRSASESLSTSLSSKVDKIDVGLANALKSTDPSLRVLVVRCFGAIDDLDGLLDDALSEEKYAEVRQMAIQTLQYWIGCSRDNDYRLYEALKGKYKEAEAENIMSLLHGFSAKDQASRETYETLIDYLNRPNLAIRELAAMELYRLVPAGRKIAYSPVADSREREHTQGEWLKLLKSGQIPPRPMNK